MNVSAPHPPLMPAKARIQSLSPRIEGPKALGPRLRGDERSLWQ
jgi:hypothetical protein